VQLMLPPLAAACRRLPPPPPAPPPPPECRWGRKPGDQRQLPCLCPCACSVPRSCASRRCCRKAVPLRACYRRWRRGWLGPGGRRALRAAARVGAPRGAPGGRLVPRVLDGLQAAAAAGGCTSVQRAYPAAPRGAQAPRRTPRPLPAAAGRPARASSSTATRWRCACWTTTRRAPSWSCASAAARWSAAACRPCRRRRWAVARAWLLLLLGPPPRLWEPQGAAGPGQAHDYKGMLEPGWPSSACSHGAPAPPPPPGARRSPSW
jgi:hypothetical protein